MPSNPVNMRSTVFAFKCKMGTPLSRFDFNSIFRGNEVKQLYFSVEEGLHLVCMRLRFAVTRIRFVNALIQLERTPSINFKRPVDGIDWSAFVFLGNQLREGTGLEIKQTLKRHMDSNHQSFFQSQSSTSHHITHMLRDFMRGNMYIPRTDNAAPPEVAVPSAPSLPPSPPPLVTNDERDSASLPETLVASPASTLPVRSESSTGTEPMSPDTFTVPMVLPNGQINMVELSLHVRSIVGSSLREFLQIRPGFNLQGTMTDIEARIDELLDITVRIRRDITHLRD